jgi:hypothetical protein
MMHIWPELSAAIDSVLGAIIKQTRSLRIATIKYRASDERAMSKYLIETKEFSRNHQKMRDDIQDALFGGGSGGLHLGIHHALNGLTWRSQSQKVILIVGDTTPRDTGLKQSIRLIRDASDADQILVSTLYVKTIHGEEHKESYRLQALYGIGRFYEYNKAERHLVDMFKEPIDVKKTELPSETARKLFHPREELRDVTK